MSTKERLTVTIDTDIAARIKAIAGTHSTSSIVEKALREMLDRHDNARARLAYMLEAARRRDPQGFAEDEAYVDEMFRKIDEKGTA